MKLRGPGLDAGLVKAVSGKVGFGRLKNGSPLRGALLWVDEPHDDPVSKARTLFVGALFDLIDSDRRSKLLSAEHHIIDPRFTPVG